jgi:hypothetical protein
MDMLIPSSSKSRSKRISFLLLTETAQRARLASNQVRLLARSERGALARAQRGLFALSSARRTCGLLQRHTGVDLPLLEVATHGLLQLSSLHRVRAVVRLVQLVQNLGHGLASLQLGLLQRLQFRQDNIDLFYQLIFN